ncbi:MAG: tetratricopeptide repeat protein [Hyphomonadaceae bacterium]|nr:tetratricopeptide repeat protein [Hyphomonadaceae bacterium]
MRSVAEAFALFQRGDLAGAEAALGAVLKRAPEDADALNLMAGVLHAKGDLPGAAAMFERAHRLSPSDAGIAFNRAAVLSALGRHSECVEIAGAFLKLRPGDAEALLMQGSSLAALGRYEEALAALDLVRLDRADVHARRGGALGALERWPEALAAIDRALASAPDSVPFRAMRAPALANVGRFDEALPEIEVALASAPENAEYMARRAYVLNVAGLSDLAREAYDRVLALSPNDAAALYGKCEMLLGDGDFERGLPLYEVRHRLHPRLTPQSAAPLWTGDEPVDGKTILVQGEQGFGDLFQFCRFIPELARRGARVVLQERPQTLGLMRSLDGVAELASSKAPAPDADMHVPLASLMLALDMRVDTIPAPIPYLFAEAERVARWRDVLGPAQRRRVGVAWSGVSRVAMQAWRSLDDVALGQLLAADADFVSVQMEESAVAAAGGVRQFGKAIGDFAELAALIENLDCVVSIDTGVAHLAGALGKPVYLMLPYRADWRWLRARSDTPWYPNMRLFRQARFGDWSNVIGAVRDALYE